METARLKAFVAAAETGTFTGAAGKLNYTPSGVSQLVTALENELDVKLLDRKRTGVTLTANGSKLIPYMRRLIIDEESIYQIASSINDLATGSITVATYYSIAAHLLPFVISKFRSDYPGIDIRLIEGNQADVSALLTENAADMALMGFNEKMDFEWLPLMEDQLVAIVNRNHRLAQSNSYPLTELGNDEYIMTGYGRDHDISHIFTDNNIEPNIRYNVSGYLSSMGMIENDLGMTVLNRLITDNIDYDVVKLPLDPPQLITYGIAAKSFNNLSPAAKRFTEYAVRMLTEAECGQV